MSFTHFDLHAKILKAITELRYTAPSAIQEQAMPLVSQGKDVVACAQTGTGKTAAFSLPLIDQIARRKEKWRHTRVLVLAPTRELASQIHASIEAYSKYLPIRSTAVFGGVSFNRQYQVMKKGVNILIATPGRLLDHLEQRTIDLGDVETLVLDEADRMLDIGFIKPIRKIIAKLPTEHQTLLFSATFSKEIQALVKDIAHSPELINVAPEKPTAEKVNQSVFLVESKRRMQLLSHLIQERQWPQLLVFTRTKRGANRLAEQLECEGYSSAAIHGNKSQNARERILAQFKSGQHRILVATDIAARGIDIAELPCVANYDLPDEPEVYVHRIGRTGRAGQNGKAISLVTETDVSRLVGIERLLKKSIARETVNGFEPSEIFMTQSVQQNMAKAHKRRPQGQSFRSRSPGNRRRGLGANSKNHSSRSR